MKQPIHSTAAAVAASQYAKEGNYWRETMERDPLTEGFPYDGPPSRPDEDVMRTLDFQWNGELWERLEKASTGVPRRLHVVLTAAVALLLSRYRGHHDVVVGSTIFKQESDADFVNTILPLSIAIDPGATVKEFIMSVRRVIADAVENQNYPMDALLGKLNLENEPHRFPLFDCAVLLEPLHDHRYLRDIPLNMVMSFEQEAQCLRGTVHYNSRAYQTDTIRRLTDHLARLLSAALSDLDAPVSSFDLLEEEERRRVSVDFNGAEAPFPEDKTLDQLFRDQAEKSGGRIAVECSDGTSITYAQLNQRSDHPASELIEKGVGPETVVAIMAERSVETIIGILGILKAGGAYLPIDPDYPEDRIQYMLRDSGATLLINKNLEITSLKETSCGAFSKAGRRPHPSGRAAGGDPAYIIYTSGSTGRPKGVLMEHRNAVNVVTSFARRYGVGEGVNVLQMSDFTFDPSVLQVFGALLHGGVLCMMEKQWLTDIPRLRRYIEDRQVHILNFVPDILDKLLGDGPKLDSIRYVLAGGEALNDRIKGNIIGKGYCLHNHYGPTETTVDALRGECTERAVTLGRPIDNVRVKILDRYGRPAPIGAPGELYIGGAGVARGYLNNPELTHEKFCRGPEADRYYTTGDRVKWLSEGDIVFLGRIDQQVKIRGYRIELGEIEHHLAGSPDIDEAVVTVGENEMGEKFLCAYFSPPGADIHHLRELLSNELPAHMVPSYFVPMEALPRTATAKIDRKALPDPEDSQWSRRPFQPPTNETEEIIRRVWAEALDLEPAAIGIDDDFFQLGGNSINILKVQSQLNRMFEQELTMSHMLLTPTVRGLAADIGVEVFSPGLESMVRLNRAGSDLKNLFIIHPLHGMTYQYNELARLLQGRFNVIGIQSRGLVQESRLPESLETMSLDYTEQIRRVQPEGPYIIVGFCMGNILGYEIVRELEDEGCDVEKMVVLDMHAFIPKHFLHWMRIKEFAARISRRPVRRKPSPKIPVTPPIDGEDHNKRVHRHNNNLMTTLNPHRIIRSPVLVIKAEASSLPTLNENAWRRMTRGAVTFLEVSGDHDSIFESPNVERLAEIIKTGLNDDK